MINSNFVKLSLAVLGGGLLLVACGDNVTKVTKVNQEASGLEVVASADSLGKCTAERSGEMKFASKENAVYVCSDSSWKNVSAAENVSCSAELLADSSGYRIVCNGDSVGVIFNGTDGSDGENGEAGKAGTSCTVEESSFLDSDFGRGAYLVVCGGDTVGMIRDGISGEGCTITDNGDGSVTQDCGSETVTLYKAFCGGEAYDPDSRFCYEDSVVSLCGGKSYNLTENACLADSLYPLCNGDIFDSEAQFCHGNALYEKCAGEVYDPQDSVCHEERLFGFFEDNRDGQVYRAVRIGTQIWMAENLNYAYMPDTLSFCYNNSADSCAKYGRLYTWAAAMDSAARFSDNGKGCGNGKTCSPANPVRGACPDGWHLPDTTEWSALETFVASSLFDGTTDSAGYALKSTSGWKDDGNGSDAFGFGALPAGYSGRVGSFYFVFAYAYFWSATEDGANHAYLRNLYYYNETGLRTYDYYKGFALSIRCVKDSN